MSSEHTQLTNTATSHTSSQKASAAPIHKTNKRTKMKLTLLLIAMMALFSSLALAGPNKGPSKYAKNAAKSKGNGV